MASDFGTADAAAGQRLLIVTGLLGAGKTTALRALEDAGWETIDNFPVRLLEQLLDPPPSAVAEPPAPIAVGVDSRTRGFDPHAIIALVERLGRRGDVVPTTLFLDCADHELERRYNETRRRHPLGGDLPLGDAIAAERDLLAPLCRWADMIVDTSRFTSNDLQQAVRERFAPAERALALTVSSFGFARGTPPLADLMFDMRFLDNPHWDPALRPLTGRDPAVAERIRADPAFAEAFARIRDLLLLLLPRYAAQGKPHVHVAFGCTGGRHRSVFTAEQIAMALRNHGFSLTVLHRNLGSRSADPIHGRAA